MNYTILQNNSEFEAMLTRGAAGNLKQMVYIISTQCDGRRLEDLETWINNYIGNINELYVSTFEEMEDTWMPYITNGDLTGLPAIILFINGKKSYLRNGLSPIEENVIIGLSQIDPGRDYIVFDSVDKELKIMKGSTISSSTMPNRYTTNGDVVTGVTDEYVHGVAPAFADQVSGGLSDYTGAAVSHYRINITGANGSGETTTQGRFDFTSNTGNATKSGEVSWSAGATLESIKNQITTIGLGDYTGVAVTDDKKAIGIYLGGYGSNTLSLSNISNCELIDLTTLAVFDWNYTNSNKIISGSSYNNSLEVISNSHKSWRGYEASLIINNYLNSKGLTTISASNSGAFDFLGYNRNYRCIINKSGCRSWGGDLTTFTPDGAGGSVNEVIGIMQATVFNNGISGNTSMYNFYTKLIAGNSSKITSSDVSSSSTVIGMTFEELKNKLEGLFGTMSDLYDAYLMMHSLDVNSPYGIMNLVRNKGVYETHIEGRIFTVDYNYKYYPAYPSAYNTVLYEQSTNIYDAMIDAGISDPQIYAEPEPFDLGLMYCDALIPVINSAQNNAMISVGTHTDLANNNHSGSFAQFNAISSWIFTGNARILYNVYRYNSTFRSRPAPAFRLPGVA